jgi:hypothetical protein
MTAAARFGTRRKREGGCMCGEIRHRLYGEPACVWQCYCRDCQLATGTGHTTISAYNGDNVGILGQPRNYTTNGAPEGA